MSRWCVLQGKRGAVLLVSSSDGMLSASRPCVRLGRVTWRAVCVVCGRASVRARTPLARTKGGPPPASRCAGGLPGDVGVLPPRTHPDRCLGAASPPRWACGGGTSSRRLRWSPLPPRHTGARPRRRCVSAPVTLASRTRGQAQVDRLPRCRPVLPPERPRGLPAVLCRIPAPSQSHLFTIHRPRDSEVTDRHRQRRSLRTRLALRLGVPPGPGHPVCEGPSQRRGSRAARVGVVCLCDALVERLSFAGCVGGGGGHPRRPLSFSQISSRLPELQGRGGAGSSGPQEAVATPRHQASGPGRQEEPWFPLTGCSLNTSASAGVSRWRGA